MEGIDIANAAGASSCPYLAALSEMQTKSQRRSPWVVDPIFDLLFVAGGAPILLVLANVLTFGWRMPDPISLDRPPGMLLSLVLVGQHLFANSHNIATYLRIWGSNEDRERFKFYRTWLVAALSPLFFAGLYFPSLIGTYVYIYLMAVFWHYAAQCYGIALIYCMKRQYQLNRFEKWLMKMCMTTLSAYAILKILSVQEFSPREWYGVPLPFWGPFPDVFYRTAAVFFSMSTLAFCCVILSKVLREKKLFPLPSLMVLLSVVALGLTDSGTNAVLWFYIPPFFHGTQYLAISLTYAMKEKGEAISLRALFLSPTAANMFAITVVVGGFLYVFIPHFLQQFGYDYAVISGLVLTMINFHHFFTDAAIWKLRDPRCRDLLLR